MTNKTKSTPETWTRRQFVRGAAGMVALPYLRDEHSPSKEARQFAYVAGRSGILTVFASRQGEGICSWSRVQRVSSQAPAHLLLSPAHQALYVANDVARHDGEPRGTIETFRVHPVDGTLTLLGCTPLSLSATRPRHLALSPDGKLLAVAAYSGGIYNQLPVAEDGRLGAPSGIFKDAGSGPHAALQTSAHPHTLLFDASGKHLLSTDFGSDQINVFAVEEGRLTRITQCATGAGSGPASCVLHPAGLMYASHELADTLVCYRYDAISGALTEPARLAASAGSLALHPSGHKLYVAQEHSGTLQVWRVEAQSGKLAPAQKIFLGSAKPVHVSVAPDGKSVYVLAGNSGFIMKLRADPASGELATQANLAKVHSPRCVAIHMI